MSLDFIKHSRSFQRLTARLKEAPAGVRASGITAAAKPYFLASLMNEIKKTLVLIQPSGISGRDFEEECRFFLNKFSAASGVSILPAMTENPYQEIHPPLEAVSSRMRFFYDWIIGGNRLIITSLPGLLKPFPALDYLSGFFLELDQGTSMDRGQLLNLLEEYGYERQDIISSRGEYARRGGIVDVFSPWEENPFRIEFRGDEIHSLRDFDSASQRSIKRVNRMVLPALREFPADSSFIQEWAAEAKKRASSSQKDDLNARIARLKGGEIYPSFAVQSVLNRKHFISFHDYMEDALFIVDDFSRLEAEWRDMLKDWNEQYEEVISQNQFALPPEDIFPPCLWEKVKGQSFHLNSFEKDGEELVFSFQPAPRFENKIPFFLEFLRKMQSEGETCLIFFSGDGVRDKLAFLLQENQIPFIKSDDPFYKTRDESVILLKGRMNRGFRFAEHRITLFSESDIFTLERVLRRRGRTRPFSTQFQDLKAGDYVVHTDYGIGMFKGLAKMGIEDKAREFIEIVFQDEDKLFVPMEDLNLVQKYSHLDKAAPPLSKLGSPQWEKTKAKTNKAIEKMAEELLQLYAQRKAVKGYRFSQEGRWMDDFEKTFEHEETGDQLTSIQDVLKDMESDTPMDRLLCGDVGYGKTEVAIRAAFKAVMDGKQVAVLCPTTVLASQHLKTFRDRMVLFPVRVEGMTRMQTNLEQGKILKDLERGLVDVVVGTHRLLSQDVRMRDLGLLIVDEEQRFGVKHKEAIKKMKTHIDVLTLTATPIPRTLNMSLTGLRDISLIETPPRDRLAIHTAVTPFNRKLITSVVKKELARDGQVYFIHNRVNDIETIVEMIKTWVPEARVAAVHGQMPGAKLEKRMMEFIQGHHNVLVSTTIIENGIDIPRVNTLIVNRADRFGLAQLYQIRGRVGRATRQAFAYFLVPPYQEITPQAKERLSALREFTELGSGFRLAARDLEIRGAGSFLGARQHGYMEAVGFDYYMNMLERTVRKLKGEDVEEVKTKINLKVDIRIPESYLPQVNLRLNLYKRVSSIESLQEMKQIEEETGDRFGPVPPTVRHLFRYGVIKHLAGLLKIESIDRVDDRILFKFFQDSKADPDKLVRILKDFSGSITPDGIMTLKISGDGPSGLMDETISILKEFAVCGTS